MDFIPDFRNIQEAAYNRKPKRLPLYEHIICDEAMETVLDKKFGELQNGNKRDKEEYFRNVCSFYKAMGYDTVTYECCIGAIMPNSGLLAGHGDSVIKTYEDFEKYPWDQIPDLYFSAYEDYFEALRVTLPDGMKAIGGVGNGVFECVQDIIGYMNLAYIAVDDPDLYEVLFRKVGEIMLEIWKRFMEKFSDIFCVLRFGDDLGFKCSTLISVDDIKRLVIPEYTKIIKLIHSYNKPFLLHSCGYVFNVIPDMINIAKIDARHSNEDQIAMFPVWVKKFGDKIANFGGMDTDAICRLSKPAIREYVNDILSQCGDLKGIAFGSGNSIPSYVPVDNYIEMVNAVRRYRGESI